MQWSFVTANYIGQALGYHGYGNVSDWMPNSSGDGCPVPWPRISRALREYGYDD